MSTRHIDTVKDLYARFGRGDIPGVLALLADDVEWEYGEASTDVPWLQHRRGREAVGRFFESMALFDLVAFTPKTFLGEGNLVVVLIDVEILVKATGQRIVEENEIHIWHFDGDGRIRRYAHKLDSHLHWLAYHGQLTPRPTRPTGLFADS